MAICELCDNEMTNGASCSVRALHTDGEAWALAPHRSVGGDGRCSDCGVPSGGFHHLGCDLQRCPRCRGQLIGCDCGWDELGGPDPGDLDDDVDDDPDEVWAAVRPIERDPARAGAGPVRFTPFPAAVAPLRARHHATLREMAAWALTAGRPCDLDAAALVLDALERDGTTADRTLDRPDVTDLLRCGLHNALALAGALQPDGLMEHVWATITFLADQRRLGAGSAPLPVLLEPLQCYGGLDATGIRRPAEVDVDFPCQCYVPYDPTCPRGQADRIVGRDRDTYRPYLARGIFLPRTADPAISWFAPLAALARRLRYDERPSPLHVDEFAFQGQILHVGRGPMLWMYTFGRSGKSVFVDQDGLPYRPRPDRRRKLGYRWERIGDSLAAGLSGALDALPASERAESSVGLLQ